MCRNVKIRVIDRIRSINIIIMNASNVPNRTEEEGMGMDVENKNDGEEVK